VEQAHADQPPLVIDALDRVPVHLKLAHDSGWKVNPVRAKLTKGHRLFGLAQALEQPLLLGVSKRHRQALVQGATYGVVRLLEPEANLRRDLKVLDLSVDDMAADGFDFEPFDVAERF
jgi:hypothetical protein